MLNGKKVIVVMPAFNAAKTLHATYREVAFSIVDEIILVDDSSTDKTVQIARNIGIHHIIQHEQNRGYGANQKTCYQKALQLEADIIVMLHPDYQYTPKLIPAMCFLIAEEIFPVVIASRMLGKSALQGGMPLYKYYINKFLTGLQNLLIGQNLTEYHTGYRAFSRIVLETINFEENSDNFIFDNQLLSQILYAGYEVGEVSCPTSYFEEASSVGLYEGIKYSVGVIKTSVMHFLQRFSLYDFKMYRRKNSSSKNQ